MFQTSDSPFSVTVEPQVHSTDIDGVTRQVIDTEGHADGNSITSEQIQRLALFLRNWEHGVNGICVVLNGQHDRFSQGIKDTLRWMYNTFGTPDVLNHICIVFTRCYDAVANPNRRRKETEYRRCVQEFLMGISGVVTTPAIPIFFVDSLDVRSVETERNMVQFHGWLSSRQSLSTNEVRTVGLRENIEDEIETRVLTGYRYDGPPNDQYRFALYVDRTRQKLTPYNGDPPRYGEWNITRRWEEAAGHQTIVTHSAQHAIESKRVEHHNAHSWRGFSSKSHSHWNVFRITWTEQWTVTTSFDGDVTQTQPTQVGGKSEIHLYSGEERGWVPGYETRIY
jgi:hypothetical protein